MDNFIQAAQTLVSHLRAQGISASAEEHTVTIGNPGRQQKVTVGFGYSGGRVDASDLRSARPERIQRALQAVQDITRIAFDTTGAYRQIEAKRAGLDANFEDIIFRSKIFSKCPNPTSAQLRAWLPVVRRAAKHVFYKFRTPLLAFGYEVEDMESLGLIHLTTALHRYQSGDPGRDKAVIGRYITQRLTEVVRKVQRKGRRCTASSDIRSFVELREG